MMKMMKCNSRIDSGAWGIALLMATLVLMAPASNAGVVAVDNFDDGNRTNVTNGLNWYSMEGPVNQTDPVSNLPVGMQLNAHSSVDAAAAGHSNAFPTNALYVTPSGAGTDNIMGVFANPVVIPPNVGAKIIVSFDLRNTSQSGIPSGGLYRWGLFNSDGPLDGSDGGYGTTDGDFDVGIGHPVPEVPAPGPAPTIGIGGDFGPYLQLEDTGLVGMFQTPDSGNATRFNVENNAAGVQRKPSDPGPASDLNDLDGDGFDDIIFMAEGDVDNVAAPFRPDGSCCTFLEMAVPVVHGAGATTSMTMTIERIELPGTPPEPIGIDGRGNVDLPFPDHDDYLYTFTMTTPDGTQTFSGDDLFNTSHIPGDFITDTFDYITISQSTGSPGNWAIDNLVVRTVVPEPATWSLLCIGGLSIFVGRLRRWA